MEKRITKPRGPRRKCSDCAHLKYNEEWGECKCLKQHHRVDNPDTLIFCSDYKKTKD